MASVPVRIADSLNNNACSCQENHLEPMLEAGTASARLRYHAYSDYGRVEKPRKIEYTA